MHDAAEVKTSWVEKGSVVISGATAGDDSGERGGDGNGAAVG